MRDPGTNAGAHVPTQGVRPVAEGLSQNHPLPEVAEDGCPSRQVTPTLLNSFSVVRFILQNQLHIFFVLQYITSGMLTWCLQILYCTGKKKKKFDLSMGKEKDKCRVTRYKVFLIVLKTFNEEQKTL